MKKFLAITLSIIMLFSLVACGNDEKAEKYCSSCGEQISKDATFCENCGAKLDVSISDTNNSISETVKNVSSKSNISQQIANSSHKHKYSKKVVAPTCTERGFTQHICSCGNTYTDSYKEPAHAYKNYKCTKCNSVDKANSYNYFAHWIKTNGTPVEHNFVEISYEDDYGVIYTLALHTPSNYILITRGELHNNNLNYADLELKESNYSLQYANVKVSGKINPKKFTSDSELTYETYEGPEASRDSAIGLTRLTVCYILDWLKEFLNEKKIGITISDLGYTIY